jgi:hypothetical protein
MSPFKFTLVMLSAQMAQAKHGNTVAYDLSDSNTEDHHVEGKLPCVQSECSIEHLEQLYEKSVGQLPSLIRTPYLPQAEKDAAKSQGVDLVYGAVPPAGLKKVFAPEYLNGTGNHGGTLADLGHGAGQVSLYAYLHFNLEKVVGIEYSQYRFNVSCLILQAMAKEAEQMGITLDPASSIFFIKGDFTKVPIPLNQFPMIFMETNLSVPLENAMREVIEPQMSPHTRVMTFNKLFSHHDNMYEIPDDTGVKTSWSDSHHFHFWEKTYETKAHPDYGSKDDLWMDEIPSDMRCSLVGGSYKGPMEFPAELVDPSHK